ncbi:hypothetical protein T492DRAFT_1129544 [Pavlovales sp. CCMP2436]|nr:hypothetical protein T492DRAFT_1129544 [Pavlovales sp. CCMP2436]
MLLYLSLVLAASASAAGTEAGASAMRVGARRRAGMAQLDELLGKVARGTKCWKTAIVILDAGCKGLDDEQQSGLTMAFDHCHPQVALRLQTQLLKTTFYAHAEAMCFFLQSAAFQERMEADDDARTHKVEHVQPVKLSPRIHWIFLFFLFSAVYILPMCHSLYARAVDALDTLRVHAVPMCHSLYARAVDALDTLRVHAAVSDSNALLGGFALAPQFTFSLCCSAICSAISVCLLVYSAYLLPSEHRYAFRQLTKVHKVDPTAHKDASAILLGVRPALLFTTWYFFFETSLLRTIFVWPLLIRLVVLMVEVNLRDSHYLLNSPKCMLASEAPVYSVIVIAISIARFGFLAYLHYFTEGRRASSAPAPEYELWGWVCQVWGWGKRYLFALTSQWANRRRAEEEAMHLQAAASRQAIYLQAAASRHTVEQLKVQLKAQQPLVPAYWKHAEPLIWTCAPCGLLYKMTTPSCSHCKSEHVEDLGLLVKDAYVDGGYMCQQASQMLKVTSNNNCACGISNEFDKVRIYRIENHSMWERFRFHEKQIEAELAGPAIPPNDELFKSHDWLRRLEERNGLSVLASTRYLLHGTSISNLPDIVRYGLRTKFTGTKSGGALYGTGLYFTNSACKAWQYTDCGVVGGKKQGRAIILVCRVALGKTELLAAAPTVTSNFPKVGHHSKMAKHTYTTRPGALQIHNEFIIFDETMVYPEFVLEIGD